MALDARFLSSRLSLNEVALTVGIGLQCAPELRFGSWSIQELK
jgi:hypothetical protein